MGVLCCHFRPKMFSPGDHVRYHSRTLGAHVLATVVGPSPNGTQFCHIRYIRPGGVTPVDHESAQLSRLAPQLRGKPAGLAVQAGAKAAAKPAPRAIASSSTRKSLHTCSLCLRQWRVPQFALRYPCNVPPPPPGTPSLGDRLPPPPGRPSRATPGLCKGGEGSAVPRGEWGSVTWQPSPKWWRGPSSLGWGRIGGGGQNLFESHMKFALCSQQQTFLQQWWLGKVTILRTIWP